MANGAYVSMSAALAASRQLSVLANNLANVDTPGYRQTRSVFEARLLDAGKEQLPSKGLVELTATPLDASPGEITRTGNPLDLALVGDGYFLVRTPQGDRLTRAGSFNLSSEGVLVDAAGNPVLTGALESGPAPVQLRSERGPLSITQAGEIEQGGTVLATLTIVETDPANLQAEGNMNLRAPNDSLRPAGNFSILSEHLEQSNMNAIRGMVELIEISRDYARAYKVMDKYAKLDSKTMSIV